MIQLFQKAVFIAITNLWLAPSQLFWDMLLTVVIKLKGYTIKLSRANIKVVWSRLSPSALSLSSCVLVEHLFWFALGNLPLHKRPWPPPCHQIRTGFLYETSYKERMGKSGSAANIIRRLPDVHAVNRPTTQPHKCCVMKACIHRDTKTQYT